MATTSRLDGSRECSARGRAASRAERSAVITRPHRRHRPRRSGGRRAALTPLRSALAFYGAFSFIPVGMAAADWLGP